jgi:cytochrome c-type biogenesis protein CcmF
MVTLGSVMLGLALVSALVSIGALLWGNVLGPKQGESITNVGYLATFSAMGALTVSVLLLVIAFFQPNYAFYYVAQNHSTDVSSLAWLYKLSGLWAGREGSFLFWAWVLSIFSSWVAYKRLEFTDALSNMGLMVTNVVLMLFTAGMMFSEPNNPFKTTPASLIDPATGKLLGEATAWGMNPLLQHWAMIIHPPTLFIGYAGLTIPFAFAIAALIVNDSSKKWVEIVDRITIFSWLFLGIGIGLGAIWAYVVLGWGGYWAWDPVENASLLPWLTGVGLLHSFTVYRRREGFKRWTIMLAAFSFALVILGTFITRSGIVQSVHAFEADPVSLWLFLSMIIGSLAAASFGLLVRWSTFEGNDEFESLTSKEAAYYFNNVIMLVAGVLVAYLTITSALPGWLPFGGKSIPATTFDSVARPVGILYLLILAVCPLLSWRGTDGPTFWKRIKWPLVGALGLFALLMIDYVSTLRPIYNTMVQLAGSGNEPGIKIANAGPSWYYNGLAVFGLFVAALLIATQTSLFIDGARKRAAAKGENFFSALGAIFMNARTQSGGYLTHIGMGIILIGLVGSAMFVLDQTYTVPVKEGSTFQVDQYTFTYRGSKQETLANGNNKTSITLAVSRNGKPVGTISPGQTEFVTQQQTRLDARVLSEPLRDIFVVFQGVQNEEATINVKINPLIWFSWGGFILMLIGTALAMWPKKSARLVVAPSRAAAKAAPAAPKRSKPRPKPASR